MIASLATAFSAPVQAAVFKTLILRVHFKDLVLTQGEASVQAYNDTINSYFRDNSNGAASFTFAFYPEVVTAPETGAYYAGNWNAMLRWLDPIHAKVRSHAGGPWDRFIVMFPFISVGWAGLNYTGTPYVYINGGYHHYKVVHELGHSFWLGHASAVEAGSSILGTAKTGPEKNEQMWEYGDPFDVMGLPANLLDHFSTLHKSKLGWLKENETAKAESTGIYRIHPHDQAIRSTGPMALRISAGDPAFTYWVEYRTANPPDSRRTNARKGVQLRLDKYFFGNTALLDMTPQSRTGTGLADFEDAVLEVGKSYDDRWGGFSLQVVGQAAGVWDHQGWIDLKVTRKVPVTLQFTRKGGRTRIAQALPVSGWEYGSATFDLAGRRFPGSF